MKNENLNFLNDFKDKMNNNEYGYIDKVLIGSERNKIFFDSSPLGIVIISRDGLFLEANRKLYDWLGYVPAEIIGKSFTEVPFLPNISKKIIIKNFNRRMRGENVPPYEIELIHKNGTRKFGEIYGNLLRDDTRGVTMDIIMVSDTTEKRKLFESLKEKEENYKTLFENSTDLVQIVNADGKLVDANPAWLEALEYSKEELLNLTLIDILSKDELKHFTEIFNKACEDGLIKNIETVFVSKTGKEVFVKGSVKGFFREGLCVATMGVFKK